MIVDLLDIQTKNNSLFVEIKPHIWQCPACTKYVHVVYPLPKFHMIYCEWCNKKAYAKGAQSVSKSGIYVSQKGIFVNPIVIAPGRKLVLNLHVKSKNKSKKKVLP